MAFAFLLAAASSSAAHGPTIRLTHESMKPVLLNLFLGTTVHFSNEASAADERSGAHVVVEKSGKLESPKLIEVGDGWHYTFEEAGTYEVFIRSHPKAKARIVVLPKRAPTRPPKR